MREKEKRITTEKRVRGKGVGRRVGSEEERRIERRETLREDSVKKRQAEKGNKKKKSRGIEAIKVKARSEGGQIKESLRRRI